MHEPITSFDELSIPSRLRDNLSRAKYAIPTPIQARAIRPALDGRDVVGIAQTGTGKTAAFALPMLTRLAAKQGTRGLILAPTRELALQIAETFAVLGAGSGVRVATVIGGANMNTQVKALRERPTVVIATPGRLIDHMGQRTVDLSGIETLVLDEADRMLDMGFMPQIRRILAVLPKKRQTMLWSATMPPEIANLAGRELHDPVTIEIARTGTTAERVSQIAYLVEEAQKPGLLLWLLQQETGTVLVFTRTKHRADKVARILMRAGHKAERIHANRSLNQRLRALEGFKKGQHRILVATDIAARGIDVANIGHVVNYDLPHVAEDYVHRIGRTARAEASGNAVSFVNRDDRKLMRAIERLIRTQVVIGRLPSSLPSEPAGPVRAFGRPERGPRRDERRGGRGENNPEHVEEFNDLIEELEYMQDQWPFGADWEHRKDLPRTPDDRVIIRDRGTITVEPGEEITF